MKVRSFVFRLVALLALFLGLAAGGARAQINLTPAQLEELARQAQGNGETVLRASPLDAARGVGPHALPMAPAAGPTPPPRPAAPAPRPATALERDYSSRSGFPLRQFGYEIFQGVAPSRDALSGAVGDDYLLGIGDELVVTFLAERTESVRTRVDREGRVLLPDLPPVTAAGRRFADFRDELEAQVGSSRLGTRVFVSIGAVRQIRVIVAGEVVRAGVHELTGLSTLLDALYAAGGVKRTGSLRRIQLNRGATSTPVDLYDLLIHGRLRDQLALMDGDQIVVPLLGPTVAVGGNVNRPAIFELLADAPAPSLATLLEWAGGPVRTGGNRFLHIATDARGQDAVAERTRLAAHVPRPGDVLVVQESTVKYAGSIYLDGHVRAPGLRSLAAAPTLSRLFPDRTVFLEDPYLLFAVLSRVDRSSGARRLEAVNLVEILNGRADRRLEDDDVVVVLGVEHVRFLDSADVQAILRGRPPRPVVTARLPAPEQRSDESGLVEALVQEEAGTSRRAPVCQGLTELASVLVGDRSGRFAAALRGLVETEANVAERRMVCPVVFERYPDLLVFLLEHALSVQGEVRTPGAFPVPEEVSLSDLLAYTGGLSREADQANLERIRFAVDSLQGRSETLRETLDLRQTPAARITLRPGDILRVNPVFTDRDLGPVVLSGEFVRPGVYSITRGERLSQVMARAGGLTEQAYPYGAVFTRERVREQERRNFERYLRELQSGMAIAAARTRSDAGGAATVAAINNLVEMLEQTQPVGRVVLEADPAVLMVRPERDTILEPGDRIHMPKRPNFVTVTGEVLNPGTVAFASGTPASDYIKRVGGFTRASDADRTFFVLPDGSAQPLSLSAWNYQATSIPPGSTIVVPRDPLPFDWMTLTRDVTGILSNLAISAAALSAIND